MKSTNLYRPARRIPAARLERLRASNAAKQEAREAAYQAAEEARQQQLTPAAEWEPAPSLKALPGGLHWSNQAPVPAIGTTVTINRDGHPERAKVAAYCHAAGFLGLVTETTHHAKTASRKKRSPRANCVFGSQLALAA
ncbi:hypothetical protein SAMN00120144_3632 [Hymenobacter roseosalivarius DSM 11622]|uniref:Uncharacterized protein n=1 Tax=Hymenobacter roseosalivarius DSM 11622 TaxID=645990 RepID=A0A1W1UIN5_9BACT|nr:hypothetical protein [Hymenobacter roseosalivarius]SMB80985.1 hypothetical protein SAMN00120144_3632 [Hymenobacter roseosalivarius DSM 11622]